MKKLLSAIMLLAASCFAQVNNPPASLPQYTLVFSNPVFSQPTGMTVTPNGTPGSTNYCYWVVVDTFIGNKTPGNPQPGNTAPALAGCNATSANTLNGSNFNTISWNATPQPTPYPAATPFAGVALSTYDVLRTTNNTAPTGACNCAVATAQSGTTVNDQSNSLSAYTVQTFTTDGLSGRAGNLPLVNPGHVYGEQGSIQCSGIACVIDFQSGAGDINTADEGGHLGGGGPALTRGGQGANAAAAGGTAGQGGDDDIHGGNAGASTVAGAGTNVGGLGGHVQMQAAAGGTASGATTNNGGAGGQALVQSGAGGLGSTNGGAGGDIIIDAFPGGAGTATNGGNGGNVRIKAEGGGVGGSVNGTPGVIQFWVSTGTGAATLVGSINGATARTAFNYQVNSGSVGGTNGVFNMLGSTSGNANWSTNSTGTLLNASQAINIPSLVTNSNCAVNSVSPAACGSAIVGVIAVPTTTTTYTVNTTAVTANSRIHLQQITDNTGIPSSPTCTGTTANPIQSARVAATSFTFTLASIAGVTCFNYWMDN